MCYRAVIQAFCFAADVIGGMACCHEAGICSFACAPCAPSGGAASGVDYADVITIDDFAEFPDVFPHDEGVFTVHGHVDVDGADAGEFGNAISAI